MWAQNAPLPVVAEAAQADQGQGRAAYARSDAETPEDDGRLGGFRAAEGEVVRLGA